MSEEAVSIGLRRSLVAWLSLPFSFVLAAPLALGGGVLGAVDLLVSDSARVTGWIVVVAVVVVPFMTMFCWRLRLVGEILESQLLFVPLWRVDLAASKAVRICQGGGPVAYRKIEILDARVIGGLLRRKGTHRKLVIGQSYNLSRSKEAEWLGAIGRYTRSGIRTGVRIE